MASAASAASAASVDQDKPKVLVLGGVGFIGRNFVKYLADNNLAASIKVADKSHPATAYMSQEHKQVFDNKQLVTYVQADLSRDAHITKAFAGESYDYVFNLCGETRFGQPDEEYKKKSVDPALKSAAAALAAGVKKFVEVSTAQVYKPDSNPSKEADKIAPWTTQALNRLEAEKGIAAVGGLPYVILRPATVYGPGDQTGITPRLVCAAVYQVLDEKMKFLWGEDLKINVVHVDDVCRAMWLAATQIPSGSIYNLADQTNLDQGTLNKIIEKIFKIKTGFHGTIISNLAQLNLAGVAEEANDKHMEPWQHLCKKYEIDTNISPYIDKELLKNNHLCIDGTRIMKDHKFAYTKPVITDELVRDQVTRYIVQKLFPPVI